MVFPGGILHPAAARMRVEKCPAYLVQRGSDQDEFTKMTARSSCRLPYADASQVRRGAAFRQSWCERLKATKTKALRMT